MVQDLIVALIVGASAWYAGRKYLPAKWVGKKRIGNKQAAACGSGCDTCSDACNDGPAAAPAGSRHRVIKLHAK